MNTEAMPMSLLVAEVIRELNRQGVPIPDELPDEAGFAEVIRSVVTDYMAAAARLERMEIVRHLRENLPKIRTIDCLMNVQKVERLRVVKDYILRLIAELESR